MQKRHSRWLKLLTGLLLLCFCLPLSGCWDRHELQERNFVLAVGIDTADTESQEHPLETFVQSNGNKRYRLSLQILKVTGGKSSSDKQKGKTYVITNTGESIFEMLRDMLGQSSKSIWFEHIQTIIISEAVVKRDSLDNILDFFLRDGEMRSRIKLYITPNEALTLLKYQPPIGEAGGIYLSELSQTHTENSHILHTRFADLGVINQSLASNGDQIIPKVELADKVVKLGGAAVFKQGHFVGYLDEYAITGLRFIRATQKSALITAPCPEHPKNVLVFQGHRQNIKLTPHAEGEQLYFTLDIAIIGELVEAPGCIDSGSYDPFQSKDIQRLEVLFADQVKQAILYAHQAELQLGVDNMRLDQKLKAHQPHIWSQLKDQWHEVLPNIPLTVSVNVTITGIGKHK